MKKLLINFALVLFVSSAGALPLNAQRTQHTPLTNSAVVKLVRAGFKEKTVIAIIHNRPSHFNLDPDRLIELKRNGVSDNIILAMLAQDESFVITGDDWRDDSAFRGIPPNNQSDGTDIFGTNQGSSNRTRGRGTSGSTQGETTTTGSATVRILRPPAEAGGQPLKLEKTPTLNNDAVIRLVEAGFSEGTIIKRIEDSPADFDLSAAKVEELRRRRVTDAIISAMTAAMSEESDTGRLGPARTKGN
jgi:hypothetical protein